MTFGIDFFSQPHASFGINFDLLQEFEQGLNILAPERSPIPCRILGYGEISTVFEIQAETLCGLACKRMSIFETPAELSQHLDAYREYIRLLEEEVGLNTPPHGYAAFVNEAGRPIFYIIQQQVPSASLGNKAIHFLPREGTLALFQRILREVHRVWAFNQGQVNCQVALDAQISNWAIADFDPARPYLDETTPLLYLDTSTPLFRLNGVEQLNAELFLRAAPSYLVWILRLFFLEGVLDRYYDLRQVILDLIANFYKEQRSDLIPDLIPVANAFLAEEAAEIGAKPFTAQEVRAYYRQDALIWSLYLGMRRFDRFLHRYLLRRDYPYILPGKPNDNYVQRDVISQTYPKIKKAPKCPWNPSKTYMRRLICYSSDKSLKPRLPINSPAMSPAVRPPSTPRLALISSSAGGRGFISGTWKGSD